MTTTTPMLMFTQNFPYGKQIGGFILPDSWPSFPSISFPTNGSYMVWPPWPQFADLPQEIRDRIVSHLRGCKDALRACALTHSSMTRAAQKELHHTINFNVGLFFYRRRGNEDKYSNPQVARHVRSISIRYLPLPSTNEVVWTVLHRLTRLEKVQIIYHDAFEWRSCTQSDKETLGKLFFSVKTVEIENGYHNRLKDFLSLLSGFQNMATLRLINLLYAEDDDDDDDDEDDEGEGDGDAARCPDPLPGAGLRSLEIVHANRGTDHLTQNQYSELVQTWLIPLAKVIEPGLRFKWDDLGSDDVETFPRFMQALAPVLGSLEVSLSEGATAMGDFGIRQCTELRTIELGPLCRPFRSKSPRKDADAWVPQLLSNIRSTKLATITLKFAYETVADFRALDFGKLSQVLLRPPLSGAEVILSLPDSPHEDSVFHFYTSVRMSICFHDVTRRGMLKTVFH